jgi:hypothetical protein
MSKQITNQVQPQQPPAAGNGDPAASASPAGSAVVAPQGASGAAGTPGCSWSKYTKPVPPEGRSALPKEWLHTATWRQDVQRTRIMLLCDLCRLDLTDQCRQQERTFLIDELLEDADRASKEKVRFWKWWWGTEIERAMARLHEVRQRTIGLLPGHELLARAAFACERGRRYLRNDDKRLQDLEALRIRATLANPPEIPAELAPAIVEVLRATSAQSDRTNQEARYFRNRLLIASALCFLFSMAIVLIQWRLGENERLLLPPKDWQGSAWQFLVAVMIFGSVGALFTAIPAMANVPSDFSPFNLPYPQALLKIVFGPLIAVIGIAILSSTTPALHAAPGKWPALMLFAVGFGAGQQAVTRYVDHRADAILAAIAPSPIRNTA